MKKVFCWRTGRLGPEYGYTGGDGEILPPREIGHGNSGSWIRLGRVLEDRPHGFCAYAIGAPEADGRIPGRFYTEAEALGAVEYRVSVWVSDLVAAYERDIVGKL